MQGNLTNIFGAGGFDPKRHVVDDRPEEQVREKAAQSGIRLPHSLTVDGSIHRFKMTPKDQKQSGFYILFRNSFGLAGTIGNFQDDIKINVKGHDRPLSPLEFAMVERQIKESQEKHLVEQEKEWIKVAENVKAVWDNADELGLDNWYIQKKKLKNTHGAKLYKDNIVITPMYDENGKLWSLERIIPGEGKKAWFGGKKNGNFWIIGDTTKCKEIVIVEGYATGVTIFEETGIPVAISYGSGGIVPVAKKIHNMFHDKSITIAADNDASQISQNKAYQAQELYGCRVEVSPKSDNEGTDFNDYFNSGGNIKEIFQTKKADWLISATELMKQPSHIEWLIKGWWQSEALIMVHGPSGCGKTFLVLDKSLSIATGQPDWMGFRVKQAPVVYLAGEGHRGISARLVGWAQHRGIKELSNFWISSSGTDLNKPEGLNFAVDNINRLPTKPGLIIVDTLHRFLDGDEDSTVDARSMIKSCDYLRELYGCSTLLVHHTGLSESAQDRGRGSSSWRGALENEINVKNKKGSIVISQKKMKDSELLEDMYAKLESIKINGWFDEDMEPVSTAVLLPDEKPIQKESKTDLEDISLLTKAWEDSGKEIIGENPKISESAFKEFFRKKGKSEDSIYKTFNLSLDRTSPVKRLVSKQIIVKELNYFRIISPEISSQMMLIRQLDI